MSALLHRGAVEPRMLWTCMTPGCEAAGQGFADEPTHCSLCLADLTGVYDMTGTFATDDELREGVGSGGTQGR